MHRSGSDGRFSTARLLYGNSGVVLALGLLSAGWIALLLIRSAAPSGIEAGIWERGQWLFAGFPVESPLVAALFSALGRLSGADPLWNRVASIVACALSAWCVWRLTVRMYPLAVAFWATMLYATLPVAVYSFFFADESPFAALFWAMALLAMLSALRGGRPGAWILLGIVVGAGALADPIVLAFFPCLALYAMLSPEYRGLSRRAGPWISLVIGVGLALPTLWNLNGGMLSPTPGAALHFLLFQILAFGPVIPIIAAAVLLRRGGGVMADRRATASGEDWRTGYRTRFFLIFSVPVVALLAGAAAVGQAPPFTAALPAGIGLAVLSADWLLRTGGRAIFPALLVGIHIVGATLVLSSGDTLLRRAALRAANNSEPFPSAHIAARTAHWVRIVCESFPDTPLIFEDPAIGAVSRYLISGSGQPSPCPPAPRRWPSSSETAAIIIGFDSPAAPIRQRYPDATEVGFFLLEPLPLGQWQAVRALRQPAGEGTPSISPEPDGGDQPAAAGP